jgi:hypothetical protein
MYNSGESSFQTEMSQNIPNSSMMMLMYSATFGNMSFTVQPASPGEIQAGFPSVPYLSLEALLYNGQMSNPVVAPSNIQTGSTAGVQNIQGGQTITDTSGNIRVSMGTNGGF